MEEKGRRREIGKRGGERTESERKKRRGLKKEDGYAQRREVTEASVYIWYIYLEKKKMYMHCFNLFTGTFFNCF